VTNARQGWQKPVLQCHAYGGVSFGGHIVCELHWPVERWSGGLIRIATTTPEHGTNDHARRTSLEETEADCLEPETATSACLSQPEPYMFTIRRQ
jgi:hypothetical protein